MTEQTVPALSPAAVRRRRMEKLRDSALYLCTDARVEQGDLAEFLTQAFEGGVDIIQLRDKKISAADEIAALELLKSLAEKYDRLFAVNDRADIALLVGADIFHVGQDDLTPAQARSLLGEGVLIGRSTHSPAQAQEAMDNSEVDYFACGPVWETPTKPGRAATGTEYLQYVADSQTEKPWFAIGGVNLDTAAEVVDAGASRIVVVRALTEASEVATTATALREALTAKES